LPAFNELRLVADDTPREAALQMALDQALLETCEVPVLRVYQWREACVTIGYFGSREAATTAHPGLPVVRRWTGGGSVVHGRDAPYTLIVPQKEPFSKVRPAAVYKSLHGALAEALRPRFPRISLATNCQGNPGAACFENPVSDDLLRDGRKIAGAGQRRTRLGLLHQGSLDLNGSRFEEAPCFARLLARFVRAFEIPENILHKAQILARQRYQSDPWNADKRAR
jgi:lipoate-protein ligase A